MNQLQLFNIVKNHLLTQNQKALRFPDRPLCAYISSTGLKCAVGCLISDEHYDLDMEGMCIEDINKEFPDALAHLNLTIDNIQLLRDLQSLHDFECPQDWPSKLNAIEQQIVRNFC